MRGLRVLHTRGDTMNINTMDSAPIVNLDPQVGLLMAVLEDGTREWREEIGQISDDAVVWQPFERGHSIGALILHIADVERFWIEQVAGGRQPTPEELAELLSNETDQDAVHWPTPPKLPLSWYFRKHDTVRQRTLKLAETLTEPERVHSFKYGQRTLRWILGHVVQHESYHGGQAVLLSLMYDRR